MATVNIIITAIVKKNVTIHNPINIQYVPRGGNLEYNNYRNCKNAKNVTIHNPISEIFLAIWINCKKYWITLVEVWRIITDIIGWNSSYLLKYVHSLNGETLIPFLKITDWLEWALASCDICLLFSSLIWLCITLSYDVRKCMRSEQ